MNINPTHSGVGNITTHCLKIKEKYYDAIKNGTKTHEVRKNDRDYKVGDILVFYADDDLVKQEYFKDEKYEITHILTSEEFPDGIEPGYVVLSIKKMDDKRSVKDREPNGAILDSSIRIDHGMAQIFIGNYFWILVHEVRISPTDVCLRVRDWTVARMDIKYFTEKALEKLKTFENTKMVEI